jgi:regulator of protease activity HflC (stomatin/prohibitin superfamily)
MAKTMRLPAAVLAAVFLFAAASLPAQDAPIQIGEKPRLAVAPFSGGEGDDGENIAELFSGSRDLAQVFRIYPRTGITFGVDEERNVQKYVVSNDEYRNQLLAMGINYVVAGDITRLGKQSLLVISIIDIEKLVQIAGDIQIFEKKQEIEGKLPEMVRNIINGARVDWTDKPMLAVVNPRLRDNADPEAANVLGEILGIEITRTGKYAVYPRNTTLEAAQTEWDNQRRGGAADPKGPGRADRPDHVLSVIARGGEGSVTAARFNASIIKLDTREQVSFATQTYRNIEDGITVTRTIAKELTITDAERLAGEKAEAARRAEAAKAAEERRAVEQEEAALAAQRREAEARAEAEAAERERLEGEERDRLRREREAKAEKKARRESAWESAWARARERAMIGAFDIALSWFFPPFGMGVTLNAPFSVLPYTFFDVGLEEIAVFDEDEGLYLYPYARLNLYLPAGEHLGLYAGAGAGYMWALISGGSRSRAVFDAAAGFYLGGGGIYFKLGYSIRTPFDDFFGVTRSGISTGVSFRFNEF